ncbi:pyridoxal phosphate-dependent aminotransferase [Bradyrhizobium daqingense]|uniref:aspartate transaminase n=1 Tax=Bradyrhizobium daqingense TaxID=993502 RepID=A0A562KTP3_9BRAD|nr:pyridoxal phosphate-dependent aminotransferase [Bradyrhizobium daqingense]TWH98716.1 aspartate/methionine/tyrosine aminotransferase [Bradyrhizobium daqingense]UFS86089.1 pyridoxal phosphate-dependent aminotransferase [Bradyrhizobium daqingense]
MRVDKFAALATANAPGQEVRQAAGNVGNLMRGGSIAGHQIDFSHGDVDAFAPTPGASERFSEALVAGGRQAYTEYRGSADIRSELSEVLAAFTGAPVSADNGTIITPGTQGALFLAVASLVNAGDKVAIVQPDYFANRKLVEFVGGYPMPVPMDYLGSSQDSGLDLARLEDAFKAGARIFLFSNPNNPTGAVYSRREIGEIARLAAAFEVMIIVDQLYSRLLYANQNYAHIRAAGPLEERVITIMGPSKTESLSGYRLGIAFGAPAVIERMEKLQAIVSLRAAGYNQAVLRTWFREPKGWLEERIARHQAIRDDLLGVFRDGGMPTREPQAGSYLFPTLPPLAVGLQDFVRLLRHQADAIVTAGTEFGPCPDSIRLNFSQDHTAAVAAGRRIVEMAHRYRK